MRIGIVRTATATAALLATLAILVPLAGCSSRPDAPGVRTVMDVNQITAAQWQKLAQRTFYFGHQSVGADIIEGVREWAAQKPQIQLRVVSGEPTAAAGVLNEFPIGRNEDPESKNAAFIAATQGALGPQPVLMFKYCYVDVDEKTDAKKLFERYRQTVSALRARHPEATVVHMTLPLMTEPSWLRYWMNTVRSIPTHRDENAKRKAYNEMLRAAYVGKETVFDLAALESTRSDGTLEYGVLDGATIPALAAEWSSDGGHLNAAGRKRVAGQFLATLASLPDAPVMQARQ